jgi:short-subunit dehydrogenase
MKVIWITGASSGIGEALAKAWYRKGAHLILSSRNEQELNRVNEECGGGHLVLPLDIAKPDDFDEAMKQAWEWKGFVDIAVHNAGISQRARAESATDEVIDQIMSVNFTGTAKLAKRQLLKFQEQQGGHFVVISSLSGLFGVPYRSIYSASKHALHGYFDAIRAENTGIPIHVSMICPGYIKTNISLHALGPDGKPTGIMDDNQAYGIPVDTCADSILKAVEKKKAQVIISGKEGLGAYLKRFTPGLLNIILGKRSGF